MTECRTDGTSAFNTRTVQRRLLLLDPARGKEWLMEIQQHDGVVVDVAGLRQGFAKLLRERERCCRGGGRRPRLCVAALPPPLYIGPLGRGPAKTHLGLGGRRPRGGNFPPKPGGAPPPPGFPTLGVWGGPWGAPQPTKGWFPSHFSPWGPPG